MTGTPTTCPDCGATVAAQFHFCPTCGIPLAAAPQRRAGDHLLRATRRQVPAATPPIQEVAYRPWRAERRLVSVLFIDLVGFTTLSEQLDPEDVREIQSRYFESARSTVAHFGGSLEKFIGDAVMAVWGTPVARENDAERAVRAALETVRNVGGLAPSSNARLAARAAITTGEAAVGFDVAGQGMVTGDLVNTASRLQETAQAGTVLVDDATRRAVGDRLAFEAAGAKTLKGKQQAVATWRPLGGTASTGPSTALGRDQPFVGRETELHFLGEQLAAAIGEHRLKLASIIGVAGIGKTRLAWELQRATADSPAHWLVGRPPRWGETSAYAPLAEVLRGSLGVAEDDPAEVVRRALQEALQRLTPNPEERAWVEPRIMGLLDPPAAMRTEREELFAAWRRYLEAEAEAAPLVLLFEDLQWADSETLDFIDYLARWSRGRPILVVALARPELLESRPTWGAGIPNFTSMHLDRLDEADIDALVSALAPGLPRRLAARIRQRAEGVPLYAIEMVRMLAGETDSASDRASPDRGGELPESLHALVSARIDALPPQQRSLLLTAAVLGRRFKPDALVAISGRDREALGPQVAALMRREFLAMDDEPRSPGRGQLSFVQDLVREVAYNTLSRRERRAMHLAVIDYLESSEDPDLIEPVAEHLVAAHASARADQPDTEEIAGRAREALRLAADRASDLHAPQRALDHLERALGLTTDAAERADLAEAAAAAARAAARFEDAERYLREAIDLREGAGDALASARHRAQLASLLLQAQRSETALAELESAWRDVAARPEAAPDAHLPAELARAHLLRGDAAHAIEWARQAMRSAAQGSDPSARQLGIDARVTLGTALAQEGRTAEGLGELQRAISDAASGGATAVELRARTNLAWLTVADDPRSTSETARRGLETAQQLGMREWSLHLLDIAAIVAVETGEWEWALQALAEVAADDLPSSYRLDFAATRSMILAFRGEPSALDPVEELGTLEPDLDPQALGWLDIARALTAICAGDLAAALSLAQDASRKTVGWERAEALALAGRLAAWNGEGPEARSALAELKAEPSWGRASRARLLALRAATEMLSTGARTRQRGDAASLRAVATWQELGLPLREVMAHLDRWILLGDAAARRAASSLAAGLGAAALSQLAKGPSRRAGARRAR